MKKNSWLSVCSLFLLCLFLSCSHSHNNDDVDYKVSESENYYSIRAKYSKYNSTKVDRFMTKYFEKDNNISFMNTVIDADLTLGNGTKFYIKKEPGYISIKFDKQENSENAYRRIKLLGEKLKVVIINQ